MEPRRFEKNDKKKNKKVLDMIVHAKKNISKLNQGNRYSDQEYTIKINWGSQLNLFIFLSIRAWRFSIWFANILMNCHHLGFWQPRMSLLSVNEY
jgi:hypothetical protein